MQTILKNASNNFFRQVTTPHSQVEEYCKELINNRYRTNISVQLKIINANAEGISD